MVAEAVAGVVSGSLALIADAGHMLADSASLALAWLAIPDVAPAARLAAHLWVPPLPGAGGLQQRADAVLHRRGRYLEAVHRLREPTEVLGGPMLVVASSGCS